MLTVDYTAKGSNFGFCKPSLLYNISCVNFPSLISSFWSLQPSATKLLCRSKIIFLLHASIHICHHRLIFGTHCLQIFVVLRSFHFLQSSSRYVPLSMPFLIKWDFNLASPLFSLTPFPFPCFHFPITSMVSLWGKALSDGCCIIPLFFDP